jgi:hypothetical protein
MACSQKKLKPSTAGKKGTPNSKTMSSLSPPPFHVMAQSYVPPAIPPPAYTEARHDELAAQLEQMKAMMEQMRLDKERLEMDAKRKVEMDATAAQLRAEKEEARELEEIHKKLDVGLQRYHENYGVRKSATGAADQKVLEQLKASGEIILYIVVGSKDTGTGCLTTIDIIITNRNVYSLRFHRDSKEANTGYGPCYTSGLRCSSLYTFDKPLNAKQTKMLSILNSSPAYHDSCITRSASSILQNMSTSSILNETLKKFESVICLIPGSYKNGNWRQLDGFFGMYFNEETMEVSEVPPPSL